MAVKKAKKVNPKDVKKAEVMAIIEKALLDNGYEVKDGVDFGMTKGTIIVGTDVCDVQIKPIAPKAGIDRYVEPEEEWENGAEMPLPYIK